MFPSYKKLTSFYMMGTLVVKRLMLLTSFDNPIILIIVTLTLGKRLGMSGFE